MPRTIAGYSDEVDRIQVVTDTPNRVQNEAVSYNYNSSLPSFTGIADREVSDGVRNSLELSNIEINSSNPFSIREETTIVDPRFIRPVEIATIMTGSMLGFSQKMTNNLTAVSTGILKKEVDNEQKAVVLGVQLASSLLASIFPGVVGRIMGIGVNMLGGAVLEELDTENILTSSVGAAAGERISSNTFSVSDSVRIAPDNDVNYAIYASMTQKNMAAFSSVTNTGPRL
jgi:hypothetical protein